MRWVLVLCFALVGCGKDDDSDATATSPVAGMAYGILVDATTAATLEFTDTTYQFRLIVMTSAATANVEIAKGSYIIDGDKMTTTPTQSTCDLKPETTKTFSLSANSITFTEPTGDQAWRKLEPAELTNGYSTTNGCFADDGTFAPRPLAP